MLHICGPDICMASPFRELKKELLASHFRFFAGYRRKMLPIFQIQKNDLPIEIVLFTGIPKRRQWVARKMQQDCSCAVPLQSGKKLKVRHLPAINHVKAEFASRINQYRSKVNKVHLGEEKLLHHTFILIEVSDQAARGSRVQFPATISVPAEHAPLGILPQLAQKNTFDDRHLRFSSCVPLLKPEPGRPVLLSAAKLPCSSRCQCQ